LIDIGRRGARRVGKDDRTQSRRRNRICGSIEETKSGHYLRVSYPSKLSKRWEMVPKPERDDLSGVAKAVSELPQMSETSWCKGALPRAQYGAQPADRSSLERLGRPTIPPHEVARRFRRLVSAI
jgi:hypothetical protein